MDTFCIRSWNWYLFDMDTMESRMCCKTPWTKMAPGVDWFNDQRMRKRRDDQLNGIQTPDCNHCWNVETQGRQSIRENRGRHLLGNDKLAPIADAMLEIVLGNTCDMACRYCSERESSVWAERSGQNVHTKMSRQENRNTDRYHQCLRDFYQWLARTKLTKIIISGGEPLIMERFYDLIDSVDLTDTIIQINTNLNTPLRYLDRAITVIEKLLANNNTVQIRASLDGVGAQQEWQRQGSSWETIVHNYYKIAKTGCQMVVAPTITPLTMEGLGNLADFVADSGKQIPKLPYWQKNNFVLNPAPLSLLGWTSCYKDEINTLLRHILERKILTTGTDHSEQLRYWLSLDSDYPDHAKAARLVAYCDKSQALWGGSDWRSVYPKTAEIAQRVLDQGPT